MMKNLRFLPLVFALALFLSGCGGPRYPDLPAAPIAFSMGEFIDEADDGAAYATIEFKGRTYMPYGTRGSRFSPRDIDACVGYLVQDGAADTDTRVYTLTDDPDRNYLMEYYIGTTLMNPPTFWRATDTRGREIFTPECVESLNYGIWQ